MFHNIFVHIYICSRAHARSTLKESREQSIGDPTPKHPVPPVATKSRSFAIVDVRSDLKPPMTLVVKGHVERMTDEFDALRKTSPALQQAYTFLTNKQCDARQARMLLLSYLVVSSAEKPVSSARRKQLDMVRRLIGFCNINVLCNNAPQVNTHFHVDFMTF
jgi:hypothetical protein